jgi:hypothetical protein
MRRRLIVSALLISSASLASAQTSSAPLGRPLTDSLALRAELVQVLVARLDTMFKSQSSAPRPQYIIVADSSIQEIGSALVARTGVQLGTPSAEMICPWYTGAGLVGYWVSARIALLTAERATAAYGMTCRGSDSLGRQSVFLYECHPTFNRVAGNWVREPRMRCAIT